MRQDNKNIENKRKQKCFTKKMRERETVMKKIIFIVMAMCIWSTGCYADTKETKNTNSETSYGMDIKIDALVKTLDLNRDQRESVADIHAIFNTEMLIAANADKDERRAVVDYAVEQNLTNMSYILTQTQYEKYLKILDVTLRNRGLR